MKLHCPICNQQWNIEEIRCGIFICGIYKLKNGKVKQIYPHAKRDRVRKLFENKQVLVGCGVQLKYDKKSKQFTMIDF